MKLILHDGSPAKELREYYQRALSKASELYIVTAYLTAWDETLNLNKNCRNFRLIIGKDFGITRKDACEAVMRWLPSERKSQFLVADNISGFHPKAVFWREKTGYFALLGSSNLTQAAFEANYEANAFSRIPRLVYEEARRWISRIEDQAVVVSEDWVHEYTEAKPPYHPQKPKAGRGHAALALDLPRPPGSVARVRRRREQMKIHRMHRAGLLRLIKECAAGTIDSQDFYEQLGKHWGVDVGNRLQATGWEIKGKWGNHSELCRSFVAILDSSREVRDDVVTEEIDRLRQLGIPTWRAFLSELLCLEFPDMYPVLNEPVETFLRDVGFRAPRGASKGARYVDLAKKLRLSLVQNPKHPARDLAELDAVIWLAYGKKR